jgi:hypothetical protein
MGSVLAHDAQQLSTTCQMLPDGATSFSETAPVYITPTMQEK